MQIIVLCLFIATLLPILAKGPVAWAMYRQFGRYDNRHPREQQAALEGLGARAKAAHYNSFEALVMFSPGALAVLALGAVTPTVEYMALGFVACRLAYLACYWLNMDRLRSSFWTLGFGLSLAMIWQAYNHVSAI